MKEFYSVLLRRACHTSLTQMRLGKVMSTCKGSVILIGTSFLAPWDLLKSTKCVTMVSDMMKSQ